MARTIRLKKENKKGNYIEKEEENHFCLQMIEVCIWKLPKNNLKKELINKFSRFAEYKIHIQNV